VELADLTLIKQQKQPAMGMALRRRRTATRFAENFLQKTAKNSGEGSAALRDRMNCLRRSAAREELQAGDR